MGQFWMRVFRMYWHGCLCGYSLKVVYIRASSSRSSSSAKSPMTRDSGCESSGSTNASPEFSPPSSSVSSDSVFPSVKDEQITKVYSVSQITVATDIWSYRYLSSLLLVHLEYSCTLRVSWMCCLVIELLKRNGVIFSMGNASMVWHWQLVLFLILLLSQVERPIVLDTASGSIELQQLLAERDHLQLVLKDAERTLYAVEKERDGVINKSRQQHQDVRGRP